MKILLCTPYKVNNYGTKLQAYAVQEKIKSMGYGVEVLNFDRKSDHRPSKLLKRYVNMEFIRLKLSQKNKSKKMSQDLKINLKIRNDAINCFDQSHYHLSPLIRGYSNLCKYAQNFSAVICGSDQIWLPGSINNPTTTLEFAPPSCKRIAFAPSFGISDVPKNKAKEYAHFLKQFDSLSVREIQGGKIIKKLTGIDAPVLLDPTLCIKKQKWDELADESQKQLDQKYMFCYFLGENEQHRIEARRIADTLGLKLVILPHFKSFVSADEKYADICMYHLTPCDFINMIRNAEYVCTDSFHATVFSIIYHKRFMTFERFRSDEKNSANSRVYTLLGQLDLLNHIWTNESTIEEATHFPNYELVDTKLCDLRKITDEYLYNALKEVAKDNSTVTFRLKEKKDCCGCGACQAVCPKNCIMMKQESGTGFRYPVLVHNEQCIHCNNCNLVCPNEQHHNLSHTVGDAYYAVNKDSNILNISSSGGIFYPIAKEIIDAGGYVCAAKYDDDFNVEHVIVSNKNELFSLIGSKYAESKLGNCFVEIRLLLKKGKRVLFCGTPCQAHALKNFLREDYSNLFIIDLLCYGIQAPEAWNRYKEYITPSDTKIISVNMRDKSSTWQNYSMCINFDNGSKHLSDKKTDLYSKTYSKGLFIRPSCYNCELKAFPRKSDITIGDFWDVDNIIPEQNNGKGIGIVFPQTSKGEEVLRKLKNDRIIDCKKIDTEALRIIHPLFCLNANKNRKSDKFMRMLKDKNNTFDIIVKKCRQSFIECILRSIYQKIRH